MRESENADVRLIGHVFNWQGRVGKDLSGAVSVAENNEIKSNRGIIVGPRFKVLGRKPVASGSSNQSKGGDDFSMS